MLHIIRSAGHRTPRRRPQPVAARHGHEGCGRPTSPSGRRGRPGSSMPPMPGIVSDGAYLPYGAAAQRRRTNARQRRGGCPLGGELRCSTSMGVESGRIALAGAPDGYQPAGGVRHAPHRPTPTRPTPPLSTLRSASPTRSPPSTPWAPSWSAAALMASTVGGLAVLADGAHRTAGIRGRGGRRRRRGHAGVRRRRRDRRDSLGRVGRAPSSPIAGGRRATTIRSLQEQRSASTSTSRC